MRKFAMKNILVKIKNKIRGIIKRFTGIDELNQRVSRLEETITNMDVGLQVENGLRYLDRIRSTTLIDEKEK